MASHVLTSAQMNIAQDMRQKLYPNLVPIGVYSSSLVNPVITIPTELSKRLNHFIILARHGSLCFWEQINMNRLHRVYRTPPRQYIR